MRLVIILGLLAGAPTVSVAAEYAYVTPSSVTCREEGYPSSAAVENLKRGMLVTVVDRVDQWANVERGDQTCWVARRDLSPKCPFAAGTSPAKAGRVSSVAVPPAPA